MKATSPRSLYQQCSLAPGAGVLVAFCKVELLGPSESIMGFSD